MTRQTRQIVLLLAFAFLGVAIAHAAPDQAQAQSVCKTFRITGYVRTEFSAHTWDGTSVYTDEPIVAASWDVPIGSYVVIDGLGTYRVADRGLLGNSGWLDVAVWSRREAFDLTGWRQACVYAPGDLIQDDAA